MGEQIFEIPVNDILKPMDGCPFCRLHDMLLDKVITHITGAAMMEPGVRMETNEKGFCASHLSMMTEKKASLSVALTLDTFLKTLMENTAAQKKGATQKQLAYLQKADESCYVCSKVEYSFEKIEEVLFRLFFAPNGEVRALYEQQPFICLHHTAKVLRDAEKFYGKKDFAVFAETTMRIFNGTLQKLQANTEAYTKMFDYRNQGKDFSYCKNAINDCKDFLHKPV